MTEIHSIFKEYYCDQAFEDKFLESNNGGVSVIIPVVHVNELWRVNLKSIYREIPVKELLIGNGGVSEDALNILNEFPRVKIYDHLSYATLGYSIKELIKSVNSEWFIYLHSDVYLPPGWYAEMECHCKDYDWFGSKMMHTLMIEYLNDYGDRPYAGSQMGRKKAFEKYIDEIDDDYVYRQEDFIFSSIVKKGGFVEGKVDTTFHYHQTIKKPSNHWAPTNIKVNISQNLPRDQEIRIWSMQYKGIVKYLEPDSKWLINNAVESIWGLIQLEATSYKEVFSWIRSTNKNWENVLRRKLFEKRVKSFFHWLFNRINYTFRGLR
jgi:hypothetical protein